MDAFAQSLTRSPELFPLEWDHVSDSVAFIRLRPEEYAAASFLDGRIAGSRPRRHIPWPQVEAALAAKNLPEVDRFIFHVGHVGSTLLSRLLAAQPGVFAVREPAVLRTLAHPGGDGRQPAPRTAQEYEKRLSGFLGLWGRRFESGDRVVLKATSFVSEMAADLLGRQSNAKAILMYVPAESYLATILGAPNSPQEARVLATSRLDRLQRRLACDVPPITSDGEMVAMSWACEATALVNAKAVAGERATYFDFGTFLLQPKELLQAAVEHLDIPANGDDVDRILAGPIMRQYSKAPDHSYDSDVRAEVLDEARASHATEIRRGLRWLEQLAARSSRIADLPGLGST